MRCLTVIMLLTACIPIRDEVLLSYHVWRGTTTLTTHELEVFRADDSDGLMTVRPVVTMGPDGRAYGELTNMGRRDASGPLIDRMTSGNQPLAYSAHNPT
jgi:hypothetical protein